MSIERRKRGAGADARTVGLLIVYLRMENGLLQKELAELIGVSDSRLSDWEWGKVDMQGSSLDKVAAAFGLDRRGFVELAHRLHRHVTGSLERLQGVEEPPSRYPDDRPAILARLEHNRRRRNEAEADRAELEEGLRRLEREENFLVFQLRLLGGS